MSDPEPLAHVSADSLLVYRHADIGIAKPTRVRVMAGSGRRRMVEVVLVEGRNREVRRLLDAVGAPVRRLVRTAVGPIRLTGLAPGEFRPLRPEEIRRLYKSAGL